MESSEIKEKLSTYAHEEYKGTNCALSFILEGKPGLSMGEVFTVTPMGEMTQPHRHRGAYPVQVFFPGVARFTAAVWGIDEGCAQMLTGLVQMLQPQLILETGTNVGRSTRALAEGLVANGKGHLWTVDQCDYHILQSGALREAEKSVVSPVIGRIPEIFETFPLHDLKDIELAFLDASHMAAGLQAELAYIEAHRASECWVLVDNARDPGWPELEAFFKEYRTYPHINLETMCGLELIWMQTKE